MRINVNNFTISQLSTAKKKEFFYKQKNSFEFDKFGVIWFDKWLHKDTFGVITNTETAFSSDKYYRPTLLLAIEQNFYTCDDYEESMKYYPHPH